MIAEEKRAGWVTCFRIFPKRVVEMGDFIGSLVTDHDRGKVASY